MLKVCQIPEDILQKMSTPGLVETVLSYPLYGDMLVLSSKLETGMEEGFSAMSSRFNGFAELYARKDAGGVLLARYRAMDPGAVENVFDFVFIEMLLSQKPILEGLTVQQRQKLRETALEKYKAKKITARYSQHTLNVTLSLADKAGI